MPETNEAEDLSDCYVAEEERVLDPSLVDKSVIERLPQPTGWRILIAPFKPAQKSKGGILLSPKTIEEDVVQTQVGFVLKMGPSAYADKQRYPDGAWRILIAPFKPAQKSKGGILLSPKTIEEDVVQTQVGFVLKMGPSAYADKQRYPDGAWCKEREWVIFARYAGSRFRLNGDKKAAFGSEVRILNDDEILGTILDPNDIHLN